MGCWGGGGNLISSRLAERAYSVPLPPKHNTGHELEPFQSTLHPHCLFHQDPIKIIVTSFQFPESLLFKRFPLQNDVCMSEINVQTKQTGPDGVRNVKMFGHHVIKLYHFLRNTV